VGATTSLFGFPAKANAVSDDRVNACATQHIGNVRISGRTGCVPYMEHSADKG
jgi:hypothetical protein